MTGHVSGIDAHTAAALLGKALAATGAHHGAGTSRGLRGRLLAGALGPLAQVLGRSSTPEHRALAPMLDGPCGSDAFADRHWLSQSRQVATADGRLPEFLGRCETLEADWHTVCSRLDLPRTVLSRLNPGDRRLRREAVPDAESAALLMRRYAADFALGGYGEAP